MGKRLRRGAAWLLLAAALAPGFMMTVREGRVCVVEDSTGRCVRETDVDAGTLPPEDRRLLETGIPLRSRADFTRAMEDFCS